MSLFKKSNKEKVVGPKPLVAVPWKEGQDPRSLEMAYESASETQGLINDLFDAVDNKAVVIFGASSAILSLAPALMGPTLLPPALWRLFVALAIGAWVVASWHCYGAYKPSTMLMGPNPATFLKEEWLSLNENYFRLYRVQEMGTAFDYNHGQLARKTGHLGAAIICTGLEVLALSLVTLFARR